MYKSGIDDVNKYDYTMLAIESMVRAQIGYEEDFYLIGVPADDEDGWYLPHELAHGLFYTNSKYRREMTRLVNRIPKTKKDKIFELLRETGYCEEVLVDETQAYCATGILDDWKDLKLSKTVKGFESAYAKYTKK